MARAHEASRATRHRHLLPSLPRKRESMLGVTGAGIAASHLLPSFPRTRESILLSLAQ
jgi:hypothetical protein